MAIRGNGLSVGVFKVPPVSSPIKPHEKIANNKRLSIAYLISCFKYKVLHQIAGYLTGNGLFFCAKTLSRKAIQAL
jgi:hypothetical protein